MAEAEPEVELEAEPLEISSRATSVKDFRLPSLGEVPALLLQGGFGRRPFITVVHATWNGYFVEPMVQACVDALGKGGMKYELLPVAGALELVAATRTALKRSPSAVICFATMIQGASDSYKKTCNSVLHGLMKLNASQDVPVISGLLMCQDEEQAYQRTHGDANPGKAWAESAMYMARVSQQDSKLAGA